MQYTKGLDYRNAIYTIYTKIFYYILRITLKSNFKKHMPMFCIDLKHVNDVRNTFADTMP